MASLNKQGSYIARVALANMLGENNDGLHITVMLSGQHGIGKSMIVKQAAKKLNGTEFVIECSQVGEGVLTGLPFAMEDKASGLSEVRFVKYYVFNRLYTIQKKIWEKATTTGFLGGSLKMDADTKVVRYTTPDGKVEVYNTIDDNGVDIDGEDNKYKFGDNLPSKIRKELLESGEIHPVIVLMDEINRADMQAQKECMNIILNRCVNGYQLPWWVEIVAAMNPSSQSSSYAVNEMDPAQLDRFLKIRVRPNVQEWSEYALNKGIDPIFVQAIAATDCLIDKKDKSLEDSIEMTPSPRSLEMCGILMKAVPEYNTFKINGNPVFSNEEQKEMTDDLRSLIIGKIGQTAASTIIAFMNNSENVILPEDIFTLKSKDLSEEVTKKLKGQKGVARTCLCSSVVNYLCENYASILKYKTSNDEAKRVKFFNFQSQLKAFVNSLDDASQIYFVKACANPNTVVNGTGRALFKEIGTNFDRDVLDRVYAFKNGLKSIGGDAD